jgi:hypothetical protein
MYTLYIIQHDVKFGHIYIIIIYYYYYNAITSGILIAYQLIPSGNEAWPTGKSLAVLLRFFF